MWHQISVTRRSSETACPWRTYNGFNFFIYGHSSKSNNRWEDIHLHFPVEYDSHDISSPSVLRKKMMRLYIVDLQAAMEFWRCIYPFLADRTNGRAYATVLRPSPSVLVSRRRSVTLCIVAKRCVLEQKLLLTADRKSYMRNRLVPKWMTLDLCLEVVNHCATFDVGYLGNH